jgi:hypothetical protein
VCLTSSLAAVVLLAAYSATFISFLTVRHNSLPFTTFEGILQDGTFKLGILERSVELSFFDVSVNMSLFNDTISNSDYKKTNYGTLLSSRMERKPRTLIYGTSRICLDCPREPAKYGNWDSLCTS